MKKITSLILAFLIVFTSVVCLAADSDGATLCADALKSIRLFKGSDLGYELDREPTRAEAVVCLIRLLGKEDAVLRNYPVHPFKDVPTWAGKYVGYAHKNGLVNGLDAETFGTDMKISAQMLSALLLRALGYSEAAEDFKYEEAVTFATETGIITEEIDTKNFLRADMVTMCYNALSCKMKNMGGLKLSDTLIEAGVFNQYEYNISYKIANGLPLDEAEETFTEEKELSEEVKQMLEDEWYKEKYGDGFDQSTLDQLVDKYNKAQNNVTEALGALNQATSNYQDALNTGTATQEELDALLQQQQQAQDDYDKAVDSVNLAENFMNDSIKDSNRRDNEE